PQISESFLSGFPPLIGIDLQRSTRELGAIVIVIKINVSIEIGVACFRFQSLSLFDVHNYSCQPLGCAVLPRHLLPPSPPRREGAGHRGGACDTTAGRRPRAARDYIMAILSATAKPQQDRIRDRSSEDQGQAERQRVQLPYRPPDVRSMPPTKSPWRQ